MKLATIEHKIHSALRLRTRSTLEIGESPVVRQSAGVARRMDSLAKGSFRADPCAPRKTHTERGRVRENAQAEKRNNFVFGTKGSALNC